jgi:hypothetical protein
MSGRDVRRLVGRAQMQTPEMKRNAIKRAVIGAVAGGARRVLLLRDVFRSVEGAVEHLRLHAEMEFLDLPLETSPTDTLRAAEALRKAGCGALLVLGGDGTQRLGARAWPGAPLVPLSTGTNNVFPEMLEPTTAGAAAGLVAAGAVSLDEVSRAEKIVEVALADGGRDVAVVDAALLAGDHEGSLLHADPEKLRHLVLARAEPAAVGLSPVGGLLHPAGRDDERGVEVRCAATGDGGRPLLVPVSPGVYGRAHVRSARPLPLGERVEMRGPGVLALDGDRVRRLAPGERVVLRVVREGPRAIRVDRTLGLAAERGVFADRPELHGAGAGRVFDCC